MTWPWPSSSHVTPGLALEQGSGAGMLACTHPQYATGEQLAGSDTQTYVSPRGPASGGGGIPGGWSWQYWSPLHVVLPHAKGVGGDWQAHPRPSFCQVPETQLQT